MYEKPIVCCYVKNVRFPQKVCNTLYCLDPLRIHSHNPHLRPPLVGGHVEHLAPLRELRLAVRREPDAARVPGHVAGVGSAELEGVPRLGRPGLHLSDDAPWQQHRAARPGVLLRG